MTLGETLGLSDTSERYLARALQLTLLGLSGYGLVTAQPRLVVNGALALSVTLLPALLRREYDYSMDAGLVLWITLAVILHTVGFLGVYDQYAWYDEVTHAMSATIVAGIGYAVLRAFEIHSEEVDVPAEFRGLFVVIFTLAFGMIWEVGEFGAIELARTLGVKPPVTVYGVDDIVTDLVFNTVGAVIVAVVGTDYFDGVVAFASRRFSSLGGD